MVVTDRSASKSAQVVAVSNWTPVPLRVMIAAMVQVAPTIRSQVKGPVRVALRAENPSFGPRCERQKIANDRK